MKKLVLGILGVGFASTLVLAGPADKAATIIKNSDIKNKSEVSGSNVMNVGIDQKNAINSIKIRKGTQMKNSTVENKAKMTGTRVTNVGIGQDNQIGSVDIGDDATPRANSGAVYYEGSR